MRKLNPGDHAYAEFARQVHRVTPVEGTKLEELREPEYWSHVAGKMHQHDRIEVLPQGGEWFAELLVISCSKVHVKVAVLNSVRLTAPKGKEDAGKDNPPADEVFDLQFKGPQRKWSIIRKSDKAVVKENFESKDDAAAWLSSNKANLLA